MLQAMGGIMIKYGKMKAEEATPENAPVENPWQQQYAVAGAATVCLQKIGF
jgi:hypothetical protein